MAFQHEHAIDSTTRSVQHFSFDLSLRGNGQLYGIAVIQAQYSWNCADCPTRNSKGTVLCGGCGHIPGAPAPPYFTASNSMSIPPAQPVTRVRSWSPGTEPMIHLLVSGYLRHCLRSLGDHFVIPDDVAGLILDSSSNFFRWDDSNDIVCSTDGDRAICRRSDRFTASYVWRNCFALESVGYSETIRRYRWTLRCRYGQGVMIGFIETNASSDCMLTHFAQYSNGYGVCSNGRRITNGRTLDGQDELDLEEVFVDLQWVRMPREERWKCQFLVNQRKAFDLDPHRHYRLAVAVCDGIEVSCTDFVKCQQPLDSLSW